MKLGEQLKKEVVTVRPHDSIRHTVRLMHDHGVGTVVVVDDKEEPVGIVTDRDVALAVGTGECDVNTSACFIMSSNVNGKGGSHERDEEASRRAELDESA